MRVSFMNFSVLLLPLAQLLWKPEDSSGCTVGLGWVTRSVSTSVFGILDLERGSFFIRKAETECSPSMKFPGSLFERHLG